MLDDENAPGQHFTMPQVTIALAAMLALAAAQDACIIHSCIGHRVNTLDECACVNQGELPACIPRKVLITHLPVLSRGGALGHRHRNHHHMHHPRHSRV